MLIELEADAIRISAPAKLNLFLEVIGKRADGFHEIESVMCPISLCDTLEFRATAGPEVRLQLCLPSDAAESGAVAAFAEKDPAWDIPSDDRNLVYRAVSRVKACLNIQSGCLIRLTKAIPAAAGLGGGSSDAAAAVVAALLAWGQWNRPLAEQICSELGSDLNVFLGDPNRIGLTLAKGRGEKCATLDLSPELNFIVTHPPVGCSTSAVYSNCPISEPFRTSMGFIEACSTGEAQRIGPLLYNALESSAQTLTPWIDNQLSFFLRCQFRYNAMTGSGSSCFALVSGTESMANLRRAANAAGLSRVYAVKSWYQPSIEEQIRHMSSS